ADLEARRVALREWWRDLRQVRLEPLAVLARDGEVQTADAGRVARVKRGLDEVLGKGRAALGGGAMELDQPLGKRRVVEPPRRQEDFQEGAAVSVLDQVAGATDARAQERRFQIVEEGETLDAVDGREELAGVGVTAPGGLLDRGTVELSAAPGHREQPLEHP